MLRLELTGIGHHADVPEDGSDFVIGRADGAQLVLDDPSCSREQARVRWIAGTPMLEGLSQRQPTLLNGTSIAGPVALSDGDVIRLGATTIRVSRPGTAPREPTTTLGHSPGRVAAPATVT